MNSKVISLTVISAFTVLFLLYLGGFVFSRLVLASSMAGVLRAEGQPLAGITVKRQIRFAYKQQSFVESVVTDATGRFSFSEMTTRLWLHLPHEPNTRQDIFIDEPELAAKFGRAYALNPGERKQVINLWMYDKPDYLPNSEFPNSQPSDFVCDLETEIGEVYPAASEYDQVPHGKCRLR